MLEIIWIGWLISWVAASFWSGHTQKRAATLETWTYRAAMIAGGTLLVPWTGPLLGEKAIWGSVSQAGIYVLAAVMLAGLLSDLVGADLSRVIVVKRDHAQGRS